MVLALQSMLFAVGIQASGALSAGINWAIKDGVGQLGGIVYASVLGKNFDLESKRLRFWSTVWLQLATCLEILTPLFPGFFLAVASIANIGKNVAYLASGATKASINRSLATSDNLGDVTAKFGSQSTAAGLFGTVIGISTSSIIGNDFGYLCFMFVPFSIISICSNYVGVKCVELKTFNLERLMLVFNNSISCNNDEFDYSKNKSSNKLSLDLDSSNFEFKNIAKNENIFFKKSQTIKFTNSINNVHLKISPNLNKTFTDCISSGIAENYIPETCILESFSDLNSKYYILAFLNNKNVIQVNVWFSENSSTKDKIEGLYNSYSLVSLILSDSEQKFAEKSKKYLTKDTLKIQKDMSFNFTKDTFDKFYNQILEAGWNVDPSQFDNNHNRILSKYAQEF
ncbi:Protein root UVB sensitive 4 [Smittium culicis]|uniref:Protein root UVB sensitive 4 n=1 Tax=Smittium culicis TaxID=133412 RepID=A0A1R1X212_9FUNG|nr:Protein root UVB sensitive 4 [Smittium culicis]